MGQNQVKVVPEIPKTIAKRYEEFKVYGPSGGHCGYIRYRETMSSGWAYYYEPNPGIWYHSESSLRELADQVRDANIALAKGLL